MKQEITRFAPSPTGHLHLGGARTALFSWLFARSKNGKFLLRFEDTDRERSKKEFEESILSSLSWLGIEPDEKPIFQSNNKESHQKLAISLMEQGKAYSCNCSSEQLKKMREDQIKNKLQPRYDGSNRNKNLPHKEGNVIRFKMPLSGKTLFEDKILGDISVQNKELDDFIILRGDGNPTYNFCAAIDDMNMNITTVIRGDDHITNTLKQINIFKSLEVEIPNFAHLPMVLSADGKRLSKRDGAVNIIDFKEIGYLKDAMVNYLIKLGWTYKDQEIFSIDELIKYFNISDVNSSAAKFSQKLLDFYNNHYINTSDLNFLYKILEKDIDIPSDFFEMPKSKEIINVMREGVNNLNELKEGLAIFYNDPILSNELIQDINKDIFVRFANELEKINCANKENIENFIKEFLTSNNLKFPELGKPLRIILTGKINAPSISDLIYLLGGNLCQKRLENFLNIH